MTIFLLLFFLAGGHLSYTVRDISWGVMVFKPESKRNKRKIKGLKGEVPQANRQFC